MLITLAGKGSSGKSTLAATLVPLLHTQQPSLLVVDADPHGSLTRLLGVTPRATLGDLRSQYERALITGRDAAMRPDEDRVAFAERQMVDQALTPLVGGGQFLSVGVWATEGSQCTPNRVMGYALDAMLPRFALTLIDHEAGIEHIGRYARTPIDLLLVVATPDRLSLDVAGQIVAHARRVGRTVHRVGLVLNRVQAGDRDDPDIQAALADLDLPLRGTVPESRLLRRGHPDPDWIAAIRPILQELVQAL